MSNLLTKIKTDLMSAMKSKEKDKLSTLRLLVAGIEKEAIQMKLPSSELSDSQIEAVVSKELKKLDAEIDSYKKVGKSTESQDKEKELLNSYMPEPYTEEQVVAIVEEAIYLTKNGFIKNPMQHISLHKNHLDIRKAQQLVKELS